MHCCFGCVTARSFFPSGCQPMMQFSVTVAKRLVGVDLFILQHDNLVYFFIQVRAHVSPAQLLLNTLKDTTSAPDLCIACLV
jgi:hypothetical protein